MNISLKNPFHLLLVALFFCVIQANAQEADICKIVSLEQTHAKHRFQHKSAARTAEYDVNYYRLELDIVPSNHFVSGSVTSYFTTKVANLNSIVFDFGNMLFADSVHYHGITYTNQNTSGFNTIEVFFPSPLPLNTLDSVSIFYRGTPRGGSSTPPFASVPVTGGNLVWTLSEPYGSQEWWPCKNDLTDKADSVEIIVSTTPGNRVASNGLLLSIDTTGGKNIYHWKTTYPIVSYLVAIGVGKYDFYESKYPLNNDSLLIHHFLFQNETFNQSDKEIMPFMVLFDSLLGEYPFIREKYGHASFTFAGGMEHQTISFMGGYGGELKAHELAHQWFGNKVTCGSWSDLWLNEGFATYLTGITYDFGVVHSQAFWKVWLDFSELSGFNYPHGSVYREGNDTLNVSSLFNNQVYAKAAMSLHTLRYKIGDSAFFAGMRNFINDPNLIYGFARTTDMKAHMEASSGMNLTEFFNDWIYGKGYPVINTYWSQNGNILTLDVQQTTTDTSVSFFDTKLPYRLIGNNLDTVITVEPSLNIQQFNIPINQTINTVEFDAYNEIFAQEGLTTSLSRRRVIENKLKLYPNPSTDFVQLEIPQGIQVFSMEAFDMQGRKIDIKFHENKLDIAHLNSGLYFLMVESSVGTLKKKFQKAN